MSASPNFPKIPADWSQDSENILKGKIHAKLWCAPKKNTGRFLFVVHGQGEQSDRYEHFPFYLAAEVDAIGTLDLKGHGKSKGIRGHINNFDQYSESILEAFKWSKSLAENKLGQELEVHWCGHSLGGLIVLRTLIKKQDLKLQSVCVSAPLLGLALKVPPLKRLFALVAEPIMGSFTLANELDTSALSQDPSVGKAYRDNPLNHAKVSPRFFVQMMREMDLIKAPLAEFPYNLMILSPLDDKIVSWKASFQLFERLKMKPGQKKELQSFPHFNHESFNEVEKGRAFNALSSWIRRTTRLP